MKAQPHRSSTYSETVCCAGIDREGQWRRLYPVPFRNLEETQKFRRWHWVTYDYSSPRSDKRRETQKVIPESIKVGAEVKQSERSIFLNPLVRESFTEAESREESLTLLRPSEISFSYSKKPIRDLEEERIKHEALANQYSFFGKPAKPLEPCPYAFYVTWKEQDGRSHRHECDDWETVQAFRNFRSRYGEDDALKFLKEKYENEYFSKGLALAFSTHSIRGWQWLLVGLIRLDRSAQGDFLLER